MSQPSSIRVLSAVCVLAFVVSIGGSAWRIHAHAPIDNPPRVVTNDHRTPAGTMKSGVLELSLELTTGVWYPEADTGTALQVRVIGETGKAPTNPSPLVRVREGTEIHLTVHNQLKPKATVHWLRKKPLNDKETPLFTLDSGKTQDVRFRAGAPGTYAYWADTDDPGPGETLDSQMAGVFIVDPASGPAAPDERLFVVGLIEVADDPFHESMATFLVNGKSWPYTEHLTYRVGDHARWRWINLSGGIHPMHLHGSYFTVTGVSTQERDVVYGDGDKREVVTEVLEDLGSFSVEWAPERPGRWIFHCHLAPHFSPDNELPAVKYPASWMMPTPAPMASAGQGMSQSSMDHTGHDMSSVGSAGMAGLVVGITVLPSDKPVKPVARGEGPVRKLDLIVEKRASVSGAHGTMGYSIREAGRTVPAFGTMLSPPLVLTQDQPVEVSIVNRLKKETAVHWHGIELDSYYDGVAGWGGEGRQVTPPIAAGGSFVARFTPPRAGTFIYHTHWHDAEQLTGGLYGPLIVLPRGETFNPDTDKIVMISVDGIKKLDPILVNGTTTPEPMTLTVGTKHRFRLINLTSDNPGITVSLLDGDAGGTWRAIAKDGADLPESQRRMIGAKDFRVSVGETYDFEFTPTKAGRLTLDVFRPTDELHVRMAVNVGAK